ncbi:hypothetical protein [Roseivivax sediminis]|uniref:Uncharacterized protein n=1 Tax=Roseivivax sediminis TaxID=936889 RepID=A0A1I1UR62_9RHOB|nr:hypothetical protein [Roseivivax sediminis]SFD73075.1 hypothetical protein SAMN04515678_102468 [Roseivivax sediminis]
MKTSIKALVASVAALAAVSPAFAGGKGDIVLEPQVVAEEEEIVPAVPSLPIVAIAAGAGVLGCAVADCFGDDDDDGSESPTPPTTTTTN